ncbi:hypothetical protein EXU85_02865 [Spirosoma sp. KCTC 42546]|uniref:hypothetical protein n=1 Tax=Spirosoma sp. KCTC 42546 TaxID=2520506 RepID=UPI00115774C5|nr:hypothetical protein [Spirosoma sp. KCTC 42546]QDK77591.1 hypothetical protein EXU85_02865 [Spirosoma sp. KCTC 42546]
MRFLRVFLLLVLAVTAGAYAQNTSLPDSTRRNVLFSSDSVLAFTLTASFQRILKDRGDTTMAHSAQLNYHSTQGETVTLPVKLQVRGNFRKLWNNCSFPPLYLNVPKKKASQTVFANQNKLKLVTHCEGEEYVVREYLVYRLYNLLTDYSFRARLCRVSYVDSAGKRPTETRWGVLLEDESSLMKRNGGLPNQLRQVSMASMDSLHMATLAVFEYLIGNTDWSVPYRHNIRLLTLPTLKNPVPVPYDFDQAGIVEAFYALPSENIGITSVRERVYRSIAYPSAFFHRVFDRFNQLKPQVYALYSNNPHLDSAYVKRTLKYFDEFYAVINNPVKVFLGRVQRSEVIKKPKALLAVQKKSTPKATATKSATKKSIVKKVGQS